jgi:hypothetical protein
VLDPSPTLETNRSSLAKKWTLIVLSLVAASVLLFLVLMILHMRGLGKDWAP